MSKKKITITVASPPNTGKTALAMCLSRILNSYGFEIKGMIAEETYQGLSHEWATEIVGRVAPNMQVEINLVNLSPEAIYDISKIENFDELMNRPVSAFQSLHPRVINALARNGFCRLEDFQGVTYNELGLMRGIGQTTIKILELEFNKLGLPFPLTK